MEDYFVPLGCGQAEHIEKRSRFIGRIWPCRTEAEAQDHISATKALHQDASHNVYAYIIRDGNILRFSDDGEPGGSSGMPTMNILRAGGVFDVCCVITRYFGGTLLGTGGLARAYSKAAKMALGAAGIGRMTAWVEWEIRCGYPAYERLRRLLVAGGAILDGAEFGENVVFHALLPPLMSDNLYAAARNETAGGVEIGEIGIVYRARSEPMP